MQKIKTILQYLAFATFDTYPLTTQRQPYGDLVKPGTDLKKDDKLVSLFASIIERRDMLED